MPSYRVVARGEHNKDLGIYIYATDASLKPAIQDAIRRGRESVMKVEVEDDMTGDVLRTVYNKKYVP